MFNFSFSRTKGRKIPDPAKIPVLTKEMPPSPKSIMENLFPKEPDPNANLWQQSMQLEYVTQVYCSHGIQNSLAAASVKVFLFALQQLCAYRCSALSVVIQQTADGQVEVIARTLLHEELVSALVARKNLVSVVSTATVTRVPLQNFMSTNVVMKQLYSLRASNGK